MPKKPDIKKLGLSQTRRNASAMAVGTLISRLTGLLRLSALAWALGISTLSDIFNLANNAPNTFFDLLIGGVLASTIMPVMVKASSRVSQSKASEDLSALITVMVAALLVATLIFELLSGPIILGYLIGNHSATKAIQAKAAINLLRLFAPQLFFYGVISLITSLLNSKRHFAIPAYAPIANNFVAIGTFILFHLLYSHLGAQQIVVALSHATPELWLLGVGTTFGVVCQSIIIIASVRNRNFHIRFNFDLFNPTVREVVNLSGWTFGYVLANQISLFFILALADAHSPGSVSAYNNSYLFFQLPYGIGAYSVMAAIIPDLSEHIAHGELGHFKHSFSRGLRLSIIFLIPAAAIFVSMSSQIVSLLLGHGAASSHGLTLTSESLIALSLGLPGFGFFLACIQALQAARLAKAVFWIYAVENLLNVILALGLVSKFGVFGLSLSVSLAYTATAIMAFSALTRHHIAPRMIPIIVAWFRILTPSVGMAIAIRYINLRMGIGQGIKLVENIIIDIFVGAISFGVITFIIFILSATLTPRRSR